VRNPQAPGNVRADDQGRGGGVRGGGGGARRPRNTGDGEAVMRLCLAHTACEWLRGGHASRRRRARRGSHDARAPGGTGGIIPSAPRAPRLRAHTRTYGGRGRRGLGRGPRRRINRCPPRSRKHAQPPGTELALRFRGTRALWPLVRRAPRSVRVTSRSLLAGGGDAGGAKSSASCKPQRTRVARFTGGPQRRRQPLVTLPCSRSLDLP